MPSDLRKPEDRDRMIELCRRIYRGN